jgi:hypothetical protein
MAYERRINDLLFHFVIEITSWQVLFSSKEKEGDFYKWHVEDFEV